MMRVLLVHNFYRVPGGEDSVVREELAMLRNRGVDVELFSLRNDDIKGLFGKIGVAIGTIYSLKARRALAHKLEEFRPDVVHVHNFFPQFSPSIFDACRTAGVPSVLTLHNFRILCPGALLYPDETMRERSLHHACWWTIRHKVYRNSWSGSATVAAMVEFHKRMGTWNKKVDRFIALTDWAKKKFIEGGLPPEKISVKPNSVARPPNFDGTGKVRNGALFVGRLDEQKGLDVLVRAWEHIDYPLRIIGDGPLNALAQQNTNDHITWLGRQPQEAVQREMQAAKFMVLPSNGCEMFPMTIVEAFSSRLPLICSDLPSLSGLITPGVTGLTFPPGDAVALANQARWAIAHPTELAAMASRAHAAYETSYTQQANFDNLIGIYRSLQRPAAEPELAPVLSRYHA